MSLQIPARKSWCAYWWKWTAWIVAIFILITIDQFDFLKALSPSFAQWLKANEPKWMQWSFEVRGFSVLVLIASIIVATIMLYLSLRKTEDELRNAVNNDNPHGRLTKGYERMEALISTWEQGHVDGPEAWRSDVNDTYVEAEEIIRTEYSAEEAARFRAVKPEDARDYEYYKDNPSKFNDAVKRELLLDAKAKFVYRLLHGSSH